MKHTEDFCKLYLRPDDYDSYIKQIKAQLAKNQTIDDIFEQNLINVRIKLNELFNLSSIFFYLFLFFFNRNK